MASSVRAEMTNNTVVDSLKRIFKAMARPLVFVLDSLPADYGRIGSPERF
jgi:hypothetical protein